MSYLVASIAGVGFFAMSVLLLGVWPGRALEHQIHATSPEHPLGLSASEKRGRAIYAREGCAYCHTQQIRYLAADVTRFGAATLAWETIFDYPHLWGTRRIGPDLSREAGVRSEDWQLSHLFAPRALIADSVMPAFPYLFDGAPDRPRQEARDLIAYLETLGRARELAGKEGEARASAGCQCSDDERRFGFSKTLNANSAKARKAGNHPQLSSQADPDRGKFLYAQNCASCHGARGDGDGGAGLHPRPANLAEHEYTLDRLSASLWNGVAGTAMPAWRDMSAQDLSAIAQVVRGFYVPQRDPDLPKDVVELGARVYADRCAQCHGENGAGDGSAAGQFPINPADLRSGRPSMAASLKALRNGVEGTPMAPWTGQLSEAELSAAAYFVRGFFQR
jgi:mono/diheme cytochrome c family protein